MNEYDRPLSAVKELIRWIGDDPEREGLSDTPARVLKAWGEAWGAGYHSSSEDLLRMFSNDVLGGTRWAYDQMVMIKDIMVYSHCEHHMTPFFGRAHIAYIPSERGLVGLSKLARVVDHFGRRLQVQERLTNQIAEFLEMQLSDNVAVRLECQHMCMISRGVTQPNSVTITTAMRGAFYNSPETRQEFTASLRS